MMISTKGFLSCTFLLIALALAGCAAPNKLPVDKVVLNWTDFYPVSFQPLDNCNTFKTNMRDIEYVKTYCFEDTMQPALEDRTFITFHVTKYDTYSETWRTLADHLTTKDASVISEMLFSNARARCKRGFESVGKNGFRCTLVDNEDMDLLMVVGYLTQPLSQGSGKFLEAFVSQGIEKDKPISENSAQYKNAIKILSPEGLKQFF